MGQIALRSKFTANALMDDLRELQLLGRFIELEDDISRLRESVPDAHQLEYKKIEPHSHSDSSERDARTPTPL